MPKHIGRKTKSVKQDVIVPIIATILFFALLCSLYAISGKTELIGSHCSYDSYTYQAMSWREGRTDVDYAPHLELAIVNEEYEANHDFDDVESYIEVFGGINAPIQDLPGNKYYVSFPPFPSVPMFIISFFTGADTPSYLISILCLTISFLYCILICRRFYLKDIVSVCGAAFVCLASSELFLAVNNNAGGVWFLAQTMSLMLTSMAFYCILGNRHAEHYWAFALLACAVGCRPFQILYFFPFLYIVLFRKKEKILQAVKYCIAPAIIGGLYMIYNYIRFGSPLEFGHNYLPEFRRVPDGQFGLFYVKENLYTGLLKMPFYRDDAGSVQINQWGFAFWIGSILFLLMVICLVYRLLNRSGRTKVDGLAIAGLTLCILVHLFCFTMHKTYGGWQYGGRYFADALPAVLTLCCLCMRPYLNNSYVREKQTRRSFYVISSLLLAFGTWINIYGVLKMFY